MFRMMTLTVGVFCINFVAAMKPVEFLDVDFKTAQSIFPKSVFLYSDNVINGKYEVAENLLKQIITDNLIVKSMFHENEEESVPISKAIEKSKLNFLNYIKTERLFEHNFLEDQYLLAKILNSFYFYSSYADINEISGHEFSKIKKVDLYSFKLLKNINQKMSAKRTKPRQTKITDFFKPKKANIQ